MHNRKSKQQVSKEGRHPGMLTRRVIVGVIGGTLLLHPLGPSLIPASVLQAGGIAQAAAAANTASQAEALVKAPELRPLGEFIITSGAVRKNFAYVTPENGQNVTALVHAIEVDLTNPYVSVGAMMGKGATLPGKSTVATMVKESGAVAGINADYFNMSSNEPVPFGAHINQGELMKTPRKLQGMYMFGITADRVPVIDKFTVDGAVTAASGAFYPLSGVNEASYPMEPGNSASHRDAIYMYTSDWTQSERPLAKESGTTPTEVLVQGGVVIQVAEGTTLPMQPPADGYILRAHGKAAAFVKEQLTPGSVVQTNYKLVSSARAYAPSEWSMMVGGHTILVDNGMPATFSRSVSSISPSSDRARTAVGYSQDRTKVYLVTVEDSRNSAGVTLNELQRILILLGAWKGVNLDGGGSTQMIDRPLGEFATRLTHPTEDGGAGTYQRPVVNGIGVYTQAPQGALRGIKASGKQVLFVGEQASYGLKAYDTYYNPLDPSGIAAAWSVDNPALGQFSGAVFTAAQPGSGTLTVQAGDLAEKLPVEVVGEAQLVQMKVNASQTSMSAGASIQAKVNVKLSDGRTLAVPASSLTWEFRGFTASVEGDTIRINQVKSGTKIGYAIARYEGYSTLLTLTAGSTEHPLENFEKVSYNVTGTAVPADVVSNARLVTGLPGRENSMALMLGYDFSTSLEDRTKAAYAQLNGKGITIPGSPSGLSVDVYGDASGNMLRITVTDAAGKDHMIDLAKKIDWGGWKTVRADLSAHPLVYPVKLKNLYVASPKEGQNERALAGEVAFDNIVLHEPVKPAAEASKTVVLTIGSKSAKVGEEKVAIDTAPIVLDDTTYLPLRFIADTLGGSVAWDGKTKRVSALRGDKLLEMWLGKETFLLNGERQTTDKLPIVRNNRTLVPVRFVTEQLGLRVDWDGATKTVTIR